MFERSRWTAARRHIFLLDQRLIITKEKDSDGMYSYKDSLKVHSLSVAEKEGDNPCRFAVGTGPKGTIDAWDQYYLLEASSPEKKKQWVDALKDILKEQFELLKGNLLMAYIISSTCSSLLVLLCVVPCRPQGCHSSS